MCNKSVTINGVPLEFTPPTTDQDEKTVLGVNQSVIDRANQKAGDWRFVETGRAGGVPVYEWKLVGGIDPQTQS